MSLYKPYFACYFDEGRHIWLERMDMEKNIKEVQRWIDLDKKESKEKYEFLFFHILETSPIFDWFFEDGMFDYDE